MKKVIMTVTLLLAVFIQHSFSQDSAVSRQLAQLLTSYYELKDALVSGNSNAISAKAGQFISTANTIDYKLISEGNINALLKDATPIAKSQDLKVQRTHFANLSNNMAVLAKTVKFSGDPVYQQYCPMKKANWLSSEQVIKNPYYGNAMLSCGKVVETFN